MYDVVMYTLLFHNTEKLFLRDLKPILNVVFIKIETLL